MLMMPPPPPPLPLPSSSSSSSCCSGQDLLDLPWEDVLSPHVLARLPLRQLLGLRRVSRGFQALVRLHLARLRRFDAAQAGPHIPKSAFCALLQDNEALHQLALQNCSAWLSDMELLPVIGRNHHLQHIELSCCAQLSRQTLVAISLSCPHLRQLSLAHCEWVDSLSLRSLADHCKELESLDLTACRQLKDDAICYLVRRCARLKSLSLAVNANVGDAAVEEVAKSCPELEHLDLTGCLRVKNDAIRPHLDYCVQYWTTQFEDIDKLEHVQRRAAKMVKDLDSVPQEEQHAELYFVRLFSLGGAGVRPGQLTRLCISIRRTLAEYCPKLRALKVKHCNDVVESSLSILRSRGVELDVEPPMQLAVVLLQGMGGYAPFINLQI